MRIPGLTLLLLNNRCCNSRLRAGSQSDHPVLSFTRRMWSRHLLEGSSRGGGDETPGR